MEKGIENLDEMTPRSIDTLYIIIPAYNEGDNICAVVDEWYPIVEQHAGDGKSRLVVIDDGSKDNTAEILRDCAAKRSLMRVVTKKNGGHGAAVLYGYHLALDEGANYIFQTDSDGQTRPDEFEQFWQLRHVNDMVIGWRKSRQDGFSRIVVTKVLKLFIKLIFGVVVTDSNTPYRLIKAETLRKYIELIPAEYFLANVLLSVIFCKKQCAVTYLPITFRPRQGGVNSINMRRIISIGWRAWRDFMKMDKMLSGK